MHNLGASNVLIDEPTLAASRALVVASNALSAQFCRSASTGSDSKRLSRGSHKAVD